MDSEKLFTNKFRLHAAVFGDVFMRFYYQLSSQGAVVLKEFFADRKAFSAAIADAVVESLMQRCPALDEEKLSSAVFDSFGKSEQYRKLVDGTDAAFEVGEVVRLLDPIITDAINSLPDEVIEQLTDDDFKAASLRFDGHYEPFFFMPATPPLGVMTEVRPAP